MLYSKIMAGLVMVAATTAAAQNVQILDVQAAPMMSLGGITHYEVSLKTVLPANFPKPEAKLSLKFSCLNGLQFQSVDSEETAKAFIAFAKPKYSTQSPFTGQVGNVNMSCANNRLTISSPKLAQLWTTVCASKTRCDPNAPVTNVSRILAFSPNGQMVQWSFGMTGVTLSTAASTIKVTDGTSTTAVAFTQNGKTSPLWVSGSPSKKLPYNNKVPFTLSITGNDGKTWNNITIEPGHNRVTLWQSKGKAVGDAPAVN